jgi:predicted metal-dependent hydrolase
MVTEIDELWQKAIKEHNERNYHESHETFEDLWLELDKRNEKDTVQTLAQADALAVHIETGNLRAAQRLMKQLPELLQTFPENYRNIDLKEMKNWIKYMILTIPPFGEIKDISKKEPPKLIHC